MALTSISRVRSDRPRSGKSSRNGTQHRAVQGRIGLAGRLFDEHCPPQAGNGRIRRQDLLASQVRLGHERPRRTVQCHLDLLEVLEVALLENQAEVMMRDQVSLSRDHISIAGLAYGDPRDDLTDVGETHLGAQAADDIAGEGLDRHSQAHIRLGLRPEVHRAKERCPPTGVHSGCHP